jgi:hypothetical protein
MISKLTEPGTENGDWQEEVDPKLTIWHLFEGADGLFVMACGVILPALMIAAFSIVCLQRLTLVFFDHPLETLAEYFLCSFIPTTIFMVWSSLRKNMVRYSHGLGIAMGIGVGSSAVVAAIATYGALAASPIDSSAGLLSAWVILPALLSLAAGVFVIEKVRRTRDFASSRNRIVTLGLVGAALAFWTFVGAEGKSFYIRLAEVKAASSIPADQKEGLSLLRTIYPEREMRIECTDSRAAGLAGLFLPLNNNSQRELYFAVTGEPFGFRDIKNDNLTALSDESLARQIVGDPIPGLSMLRSSMNGTIRPGLLLSTVSWTFVFKNESQDAQEARAEVAIPQGAVVNQLTLWNKGEPQEAKFVNRAQAQDPGNTFCSAPLATITDVGQGRMLISCAGVPAQGELKLRMSAVIPMKPDSATTALLTLPKFIASNFDLTGEHEVRLRSPLDVSSNAKNLKHSINAVKDHLVTGSLTTDNLMGTGFSVTAARSADCSPIVFEDKISKNADAESARKSYVVRMVTKAPAARPSQLVVVLDGSSAMEKYRSELATTLKTIPSGIPTSVILASNDLPVEALSITQSVAQLEKQKLTGGQNNLVAMVKAAEVAGETPGSAVLWIHGPQPESNREIYIMGQYEARPSFYDFPIQNSYTDTAEFFRSYGEIGPFETVPTTGALAADLGHLFSKWNPGSFDYHVSMTPVATIPQNGELISKHEEPEVVALWAKELSTKYVGKNASEIGSQIGTASHIVTQKSAAICSVSTQYPGEPTITYEKVRVNNLANMEGLLNIFANLTEVVGVLAGVASFCFALVGSPEAANNAEQKKPSYFKRGQLIAFGVFSILLGLMTPGILNWFVASARNANLFS